MTIFVISPVIESESIKLSHAQDYMKENFSDLGIKVEAMFVEVGPTSVENEIDDALSIPGLLLKAIEAVKQGATGIVIDCMCDPGVKAIRTALDIPVIGPAETSFHIAALLGHRFSVIDVGDDTGPMVEDLVKRYGLASKFASIHGTSIPVEHISNSKEHTYNELFKAALRAIEQDHADVIVLGCTGFTGAAQSVKNRLLEKGYNVPVIDPLPLTIRVMASLLKEGHCHSKKAFPTPKEKKGVRGYDLPLLYNVAKL